MKWHPMIYSAPSVRAILAGRKSQTRRSIKDGNSCGNWKASELDLSSAWVDPGPDPLGHPGPYLHAPVLRSALVAAGWPEDDEVVDRLYPRWRAGDRLWIREAWWQPPHVTPRMLREGADTWPEVAYDADETDAGREQWRELGWKRRSPRFMPRWASRLTLEITEIRAQRLQEISADDAEAEGVKFFYEDGSTFPLVEKRAPLEVHAFAHAWDALQLSRQYTSIRGGLSWASNPWVWALSFKRVEGR